ncbi:WD40 repeat domain-containing protein [Streptomyces sp. NBC_00568]|uniref:WD40 repeat domain-containing protein n=1 Tax=Streptomyces sp. NBC_00568 TaxID=2975779 RepID=UPI002250A11D|nr:WD40 repeat domain-containing protein [Streptomyces sp. NBC_00568]MCX4993458.1 caspase family protein [Streptomyces sp. NBC_00568]
MSGTDGSEPSEGEGPRRYLIATAVSRYPKCADWDRPGLVRAREQVVELFTQQLGYRHESALGLDPTVQQLREHLRAFCTSAERREDDLVVIYVSGHGEVLEDGGEHVLLMSDTDPVDVPFTSLPTADLVRVIRGTRVRRLLLILDTCYSGQGGNELAAKALERLGTQWAQSTTGTGLVIVSSAQPHQQAKAGLFPELLSQAVTSRATAGHGPTHLSVSAVVQQMNGHPDKPAYQHISLSLLGLTGEPPDFLTNPRHNVRLTDVDLALQDAAEFDAYARRRDTEFTTRLLVRAMGYHGDGAHGWWFCGRHQVLAELADWLNWKDPLRTTGHPVPEAGVGDVVRVVTAGPGSGKTAVLGLISALALPERRRTVPVDTLGLDEKMIPGEGSIDVVMYAQNLTNSEVLGGLAAAVGLKSTRVGDLLEGLKQRNGKSQRPFTVLIDALDEAATPDTLCSQIIRPLIEHSQGRIRLLLGTRPYLLDRLGIDTSMPAQQKQVIDLDNPDYADHQALLAYTLRNLIQSRRTSSYRMLDGHRGHLLLRRVAEAVAAAAGTSFLVARFAAYTLASAEAVADPHDPAWRASLPRHAGQAMRDDLTRRLGPDAQRATDLLRPLAYAEGQGLPWEDIWAPLASAVSGRSYTDDDLLWLRSNAGSYVVEATENGRSAYRLYHQALTEHLREGTDAITIHGAFVDILTACVPYRGDASRDWSRAHPYTLNHLATHAAAAGRVDDILEDSEYLVHARPDTLTPQLRHATSDTARLTAAVYRTALNLHATAPAPVRRIALALNAARAGAAALHEQLNRQAQPGTWIPTSATGSDFTTALQDTITMGSGPVSAVACTVLDGAPIAITGGDDGTVRIWDLTTRLPIGEPLAGHTDSVFAVACTVLDGTPIAITGSRDSTVRIWDLTTRLPIGEPHVGHFGWVSAVACTVLDGIPIAITGGNDGTVRVWDLTTRLPIGEPLMRHTGPVFAVACTVLDGAPIAITGSDDTTVRVWDLTTRRMIGEPLTGHTGPVSAVACTVLDGAPIAITGSNDTTVRVWDLTTRRMIGEPLTGHTGPVSAVACTVLDGAPIAITGSNDTTVRVWDLTTRRMIGEPLTGHTGPVSAVACTVLDGTPIAITGGDDGTAQIWDLSGNTLPIRTEHGLMRIGTAVACTVLDGALIAITGSNDGTVQVWDLTTRLPIGEPLTGHTGPVSAVACTVLDGTPIAITGGHDGTIRVWDLVTRRPIGKPLTLHFGWVSTVACTVLDGTPIAITGSSAGFVQVWDLVTRQQLGKSLTVHVGPVGTVACSVLDGTQIAIADSDDGTVRVWDLVTRRPIGKPLAGHTGWVSTVACTVLDGTPIAITGGHDGTIRVWDLVTRRPIGKPLAGHTGWVSAVACTVLDGTPIAITSGHDGTAQIWDLRAGRLLQCLVAPACGDVALTSDGRIVVVLGRDIAVFERT